MRLAQGPMPHDVPAMTPPRVRRLLGRAGVLDRPAGALASGINAVYDPARALQGLFVMVVVTLLYVVSGIVRAAAPADDLAARIVAIVGLLVLIAGGYLGGEMAFGFGSMVDHNAFRDEVPEFTPAGSLADLADGMTRVNVAGQRVLLVRQGEVVTAIGDVCSHAGGPLHEGSLEHGVVTCPWHGSRFRVADGSIARGPATFPQPVFEVQLTPDGRIAVRSRSP